MAIGQDLKNEISHGDWKVIADLYNENHSSSNKSTVTPGYVLKVVTGQRPASPGTAAFDILSIAESYLKNKSSFKRQLQKL
jgi:hypothetical protein